MRASIIAAVAALPLLAGTAFAQGYQPGYQSYDGSYRPYNPGQEAREQQQTDQLNTTEARQQERLDRREAQQERRYERAERQWQRDYADWQDRDAAARRWNQRERFRPENRVGGW